MSLYKNPKYYEIAFSFRNIPKEVRFFEKAIRKFSKVQVRKVMELASGTSPYLEEWHKRGYEYFGLDLNQEMLKFVEARAKQNDLRPRLFRRNMDHFSLGKLRVDLVYVLLGSLYVKSNEDFFRHIDSVARVLKSGGLYILDGVIWFRMLSDKKQTWTSSKGGTKVRATFHATVTDPVAHLFREDIVLDIDDHGNKKRIRSSEIRKLFFPQEFLALIERSGKFECLGWFNNFDINRPATSSGRQVVVLRKR